MAVPRLLATATRLAVAVNEFDAVYDYPDAEDMVVIRMTKRQWWHLDDWRAEHPDRYPKRAAESAAAWRAIHEAQPEKAP